MRAKLLVVVAAAIAAMYAATASGREPIVVDAREPSVEHEAIAMPPTAHVETTQGEYAEYPSLPPSLGGTAPDGDASVTISRGTIRLFDYYLTTLGELDLAGVRRLVEADLHRRELANAAEVLALFDRYVAYLGDLRDITASTVDSYFERVLVLQQRHFGRDAEALFGADNALAARLLRLRRRSRHRCRSQRADARRRRGLRLGGARGRSRHTLAAHRLPSTVANTGVRPHARVAGTACCSGIRRLFGA